MEVYHLPKALDGKTADALFSNLQQYDKWIQSSCMGSPTPRLQQWFATSHSEKDMSYKFGGRRYQPETYPEWLTTLQTHIITLVTTFFSHRGESFRPPNSVLINKYRDGEDKIQWHADNNPEFGEKPTIISVNVGETRRFCIKPSLAKGTQGRKETKTFHLQHGDILIMAGTTQEHYVHCVPKETKPSHAFPCRYNLTFRPYTKTTLPVAQSRKRKRPAAHNA
jgi:alkylated DNA repair dioxygenase AlkB